MVLSSWPWSLWEFTRFIWWMQTEHRVAANPQTKPTDLGCESTNKWLLPSTSTIAICYYYSARKLIFYHPTEGGRLSQPRHCKKGAQPVPKAVHRSGCRDKHSWPRPLTPQSIMPSLNHWLWALIDVNFCMWSDAFPAVNLMSFTDLLPT